MIIGTLKYDAGFRQSREGSDPSREVDNVAAINPAATGGQTPFPDFDGTLKYDAFRVDIRDTVPVRFVPFVRKEEL